MNVAGLVVEDTEFTSQPFVLLTTTLVNPTGIVPLIVIELACVTGPAVALLQTPAL